MINKSYPRKKPSNKKMYSRVGMLLAGVVKRIKLIFLLNLGTMRCYISLLININKLKGTIYEVDSVGRSGRR